jgi:hypothetical protein
VISKSILIAILIISIAQIVVSINRIGQ